MGGNHGQDNLINADTFLRFNLLMGGRRLSLWRLIGASNVPKLDLSSIDPRLQAPLFNSFPFLFLFARCVSLDQGD